MSELIRGLRFDHANMSRMLDAVARQLAVFRGGGAPEYEIVEKALDYCQNYAPRLHHPKEEAIWHAVMRHDSEALSGLEDLEAEHRDIIARCQSFADVMSRILRDEEVSRDDFLQLAHGFLEFYRGHMQSEEDGLFATAEALLSDAEWRELAQAEADAPEAMEDPLFGPNPAERFKALRNEVLEMDLYYRRV